MFPAILAVLLLASGPSSPASSKAEAERLKREAFQHFARGEHAAAIEAMERAYATVPHPDLLFNIAVIYDRWGDHCAESLDAFRRFFAVCEACKSEPLAREKEAEVAKKCEPAPVPAKEPSPPAPVLQDRPPEIPDRTLTAPPVPADRSTLPLWLTFGAGTAGALAGTIFTVRTLGDLDAEQTEKSKPIPSRATVEHHQSAARTDAIAANIGFGVALAGLATGTVLLILDTSTNEPPPAPRASGLALSF